MRRWLKNVWFLSIKELRSLSTDYILLAIIVFVFTGAVYSIATGVSLEVRNASIAVLDHDHSGLSFRVRDALRETYFKTPVEIQAVEAYRLMDDGTYVFILDIPPEFERDVLAGRKPQVQLLIDATAMTQAGVGLVYIQQIFNREISAFTNQPGIEQLLPIKPVINIMFNPNNTTAWFTSVMQVVNMITLLAMILVGAAVIREREHGTIEHLLVMPVGASEIAFSKVFANDFVILIASLLSLWFVVHQWIGVPISGSLWLFAFGTVLYLFSISSLGIFLATVAPTMPQFGLLILPVYAVSQLLSGSTSPRENMPDVLQLLTQYWPMTQFAEFSQNILYRGAGWGIVWPQLVAMSLTGVAFMWVAILQFRSMLSRQG